MYNFQSDVKYEALFGGFIWSHILLQDLDKFIELLKRFLKPNGRFAFIDSKNVEGTNHDMKRITKTDEIENTYQTRKLKSGREHLVLKNFPTQDFIDQKLSKNTDEIEIVELEYYWIATCKLK